MNEKTLYEKTDSFPIIQKTFHLKTLTLLLKAR